MPVYEYICPACHTHFEHLRLMQEADQPAPCPRCEAIADRQISRFTLKRSSQSMLTSLEPTGARKTHAIGCSCCSPDWR